MDYLLLANVFFGLVIYLSCSVMFMGLVSRRSILRSRIADRIESLRSFNKAETNAFADQYDEILKQLNLKRISNSKA